MTQNDGGWPPPYSDVHAVSPHPQKKRWPWVLGAIVLVMLAGCGLIMTLALGAGQVSNSVGVVATPETMTTPDPGTRPTVDASTPEPTPTTEPKAQTFGAGTYEVGKKSDPDEGTIKPGTFILLTSDHCYWERLSGFGGSFDEIIANDNLDATGDKAAQARITIKKTDKGLTLNGNCILGQKGGLK